MKIRFKLDDIKIAFLYMYVMYPFFFRVLPNIQEVLLYAVLCVYLFKNVGVLNELFIRKKRMFYIIVTLLFVHLLTILIPLMRSTYDFSLCYRMFSIYKTAVRFLVLVVYTIKHYYNDREKKFFQAFINATCLYVLFSLIIIFIPNLKDIWRVVFHNRNLKLTYVAAYQLRFGLCGYSGYDFTYMCTYSFVMLVFAYFKKYQNEKQVFIKTICLLVGNFLYARVGLLASAILIVMFLLYIMFIKKKFLLIMKYVVTIGVFIAVVFWMIGKNSYLSDSINLVMELFINYGRDGELRSASTDVLMNMYYIPDVDTALFGDGKYYDYEINRTYLQTDVGLIRYLFFGGIVFELLFYFIPVKLILGLKHNRDSQLIIVMMLLTLLIMEMKGEMFIYYGGFFFALASMVNNGLKNDG